MTIKEWVEDQKADYAKWRREELNAKRYFEDAISFCEEMSRHGGVELTIGRADRILNALERDYDATQAVAA